MAFLKKQAIVVISSIFFFIINAVYSGGPTLVLVDNLAIRETHSIFFKSLQGKISLFSLLRRLRGDCSGLKITNLNFFFQSEVSH